MVARGKPRSRKSIASRQAKRRLAAKQSENLKLAALYVFTKPVVTDCGVSYEMRLRKEFQRW